MYVKYFPALVSQRIVQTKVQFVGGKRVLEVSLRDESDYIDETPKPKIYEPGSVGNLLDCASVMQPLGNLVFARSGDKGGNANVGLWVRNAQAWPWLQHFLTTPRLIQLLGGEWKDYFKIERCEFPHIWAVHFVIRGILEDGVSSNKRLDGFAKSIGEFLRARYVELPKELLP